jgi:hypothetical protein
MDNPGDIGNIGYKNGQSITPGLLVGSVLSVWVNPRFIGRVCVECLGYPQVYW